MAITQIPSEFISTNAISGTIIADNAITAVHIATNAVSGTLIADNAVTAVHIATNAISGTLIADNAVTAVHVAGSSITATQIQDNAIGTGQLAGIARGKIIYGDSSGDPQLLALGSNGQVLKSDGSDITWGSISQPITALNNATENELVTVGATTTELEAESGLTWDTNTLQVTGALTVGVDDTGHDVKFFGATTARYTLWNQANDSLDLMDNTYLRLGTSGDLNIFHDGSNSRILNEQGVLYIDNGKQDANLILRTDNGSGGLAEYIVLDGGGGNTLLKGGYGTTRLATSSTGVTVTGIVTASSGLFQTERGSAAAPTFTFSDDTDTGMYNVSNADLGFTVGGTDRLHIKASGNVGIGDTSPSETLVVDASGGANVMVARSASGTGGVYLESDGTNGVVRNPANNPLLFQTNGNNTRMRIRSNGSVGIGTAGYDTQILAVNSGTENTVFYGESTDADCYASYRDNSSTQNVMVGATGNNLCVQFDGTERMRVEAGGDVGIGTNNPYAKLNVAGIIRAENSAFLAGREDAGDPAYAFHDDSDTGMFNIASNILAFATAGAERMRITSAGYLCVGASAPITASYIFTYAGSSQSGYQTQNLTTGATNYAAMFKANGTSTIGSINCTNTATQFNTSSDYRLKENVDYTWEATTRLKQLKPARFNWIADDTNTLEEGFLAHEVSSIVPEAICGEKDGAEMQGMDHSKLVPLMVKTIQELEARIATLEG